MGIGNTKFCALTPSLFPLRKDIFYFLEKKQVFLSLKIYGCSSIQDAFILRARLPYFRPLKYARGSNLSFSVSEIERHCVFCTKRVFVIRRTRKMHFSCAKKTNIPSSMVSGSQCYRTPLVIVHVTVSQ